MDTTFRIGGLIGFALLACTIAGCSSASDEDNDAAGDEEVSESSEALKLSAGANGASCYLSPYNCKFRVAGGNRIQHTDGSVDWAVDKNVNILDGNGDLLGVSKTATLKFNYGQRRSFGGKTYVYAMTTSNKSSGWFPLASVVSHDTLSSRIGNVDAHRAGLDKMACYEIRDSIDDVLASKKVVYNSQLGPGPAGEAAGDYLPRLRANGKRSVNIAFNVPGSGLGGPAVDHFPSGTKFQRLNVPTDAGPPSIDIKLWSQDSAGNFKKPAGVLKFIYGYVATKTGETRTGWIPLDALRTSTGCK